ncbi:MAG: ABC transporter ATP-binding protein, partial [Thermotogae bacterium]|nr:ABC transporter ATP-binding protein [Thermotogota bacterium]
MYFYPLVLMSIIDSAVYRQAIPYNGLYQLVLLFGTILIFEYVGNELFNRNLINTQMSLRERIFEASIKLNPRKIREDGTTYYARLINEDVTNLFQFLHADFLLVFFGIVRIIPVLATVYVWSKMMFAFFTIPIFSYFLYEKLHSKRVKPRFAALLDRLGRILHFINETLEKLLTIQCFNYKEKRQWKYEHMASEISGLNKKITSYQNLARILLVDLPIFATRGLVIPYSVHEVIAGNMSAGRVM